MLRDGAEQTVDLGILDPDEGAPPRLFSPSHPNAVDTAGPLMVQAINDLHKQMRRPPLRAWQRLVLHRAFELDSDGEYCWRTILVLCPRGAGKSWLLQGVAMLRLLRPELFHGGAPQGILHTSRRLANAIEVQSQVWGFFEDRDDAKIRRRSGGEQISMADGSVWTLAVPRAAYGLHNRGLLIGDEAHGIDPIEYARACVPTQVAVTKHAQQWLFSTRHSDETAMIQTTKEQARDPENQTMLAEWSADPADPLAMETFKACSPHWDRGRENAVKALLQAGEDVSVLRTQWANIGPTGDNPAGSAGWPIGWSEAPLLRDDPPAAAIAGIEVARDGMSYGLALCDRDLASGQWRLWTKTVETFAEAIDVLRAWAPWRIACGAGFAQDLISAHLPAEIVTAGRAELLVGSAGFAASVARGELSHNHERETTEQVLRAAAVESEHGPVLSAKRSTGEIPTLRAAIFARQERLSAGTGRAAFISIA